MVENEPRLTRLLKYMKEKERGRAALHVHTTFSDGLKTPGECLKLAQRVNLDVLAITDHDKVKGAIEALKEAEKRGIPISVVLGTEATTAQGHILALFVEETGGVPTMLSLKDTVKEVHRQGGLVVAPHVGVGFSPASIAPETIRDLYKKGERLDGIEILNPHYNQRHVNMALGLSLEYGISQIGADDDHFGNLGRGPLTLFLGKTSADLRRSIEEGETIAIRSAFLPRTIPLGEKIYQITRGIIKGLPVKAERAPILILTLISLRLEELNKVMK